jgi:RNA recognition motif-containing protein
MKTMNIYVGNLDYKLTEADLKTIFQSYGEVESAKVIVDRETGRSRGFGFVKMPKNEEALKAVKALNGTEMSGKKILVNKARPKPQRNTHRGGFGGDHHRRGFDNSSGGRRNR